MGLPSHVGEGERRGLGEREPADKATVVGPDRQHRQACATCRFPAIVALVIFALRFSAAPVRPGGDFFLSALPFWNVRRTDCPRIAQRLAAFGQCSRLVQAR